MIKYHFFGKECVINRALTDYSDLEKNLAKQNFISSRPVVLIDQIHSADVVVIDDESKIPSATNRPKADAIVTNLKNLIIGLFTADCTPILFFDEKNSVIGAAHAGWPGAFKNITDNTISKMLEIGAQIENIKVVIGPTIRQKSYEISQEFYDRFVAENSANKKFFIDGKRAGHYMFDLPGYVKEKLQNAGIKNIFDEEIDTYSQPEKLFSYRRSTHLQEADCGRNISVIQIS
ncbi:MAG: peptidoglycan editing factor PgeF [Pseudomonadota bacterium]